MKFKHTLIIGSLLFVAGTAFAQEKAEKPMQQKEPSKEEAAAQQAWMSYMTPSDAHKRLAADEGTWSEDLTFWMAPGAPPTKAQAECTNKVVLGGRYLESVHKGQMMGMDFEGHGTIGYDNALKMWQSSWIDNMTTGTMYLQGKWDEASKSVSYTGNGVDPSTGKEQKVRQVYKVIDDNTRTLEMYESKNGKEFKTMEIKMTRKG